MTRASLAAALAVLLILSPLAAQTVRIGLYGSSYMNSVAGVLDRLGLDYAQIEAGQLTARPPSSLDVLFLAHNALEPTAGEVAVPADSAIAWLKAFRAGGGVLFTFFSLPPALQELQGLDVGPYLRQQYEGQFASIRSRGIIPRLPDAVPQRSGNINRAVPRDSSVQMVANWFDLNGRDTGEAAVLVGPGGAHLTHVLLGDDPDRAAHLYAALLAHYRPAIWQQAVEGALKAADRVGGGRGALGERVAGKRKAEESLRLSEAAVTEGEIALRDGRYAEALDAAFRSRDLAAQAYARAQATRPDELRAVWIHNPFAVADWGWERSIQVLADAGLNAIIPNMFDAGITSYPSDVLPVDPRVAERGDQMAALIAAAHRHGVEVHAWKVNYNLSGADTAFAARMRRENRLQANTAGETTSWLCPSHPANKAIEAESMLEVVRNYDVDGIHFDYIRYPGVEGCYCDGCRQRFQADTGHVVRDWPQDVLTGELLEPFQKWRQDQVTDLVREVAIRARLLRPEIRISAAVFGNWPESRFTVGQDWIRWVDEGYLDFVCPMDYIPDTDEFMTTVGNQVRWVDGRAPLYIGIGSWQLNDPAEVLRQIAFTRESGADGFVLFEYNTRLGERLFPMIQAGLTSEPARPPHHGPRADFTVEGEEHGEVLTGARYYREGEPLALTVQLTASDLHPEGRANVTWETLSGETVLELGEVRTQDARPSRHLAELRAGDYRPAARGTYRDARGKKHAFSRRGPLVQVRQAAFLDSLERLYGPPQLTGTGTPVGVYAEAYGSSSIQDVLGRDSTLAVFAVRHLSPAVLAATRVLVIPQPYNRWAVDRQTRDRLRAWVRDGGRLLVTHDMAGMRGAQPVVPEVCRRGTGYPRSVQWQVTGPHAAVTGVAAGLQPHSYYDHVTLEPGPDGQVLAADDEGRPVLVVGRFGKGRYAALGLIPGLGPGDQEVVPQGAERAVVEALVAWLRE